MTSVILRQGFGPVRQIILQATSFCNIACSYCYLDAAERSTHKTMSEDTARKVFEWAASSLALSEHVDCRWHAGEPLARGVDFYKHVYAAACDVFDGKCDFQFSIQSNGILINDSWCRFFRNARVAVGISIDGDQTKNDENRIDHGGRGTWHLTMQGISRLRSYDIPFSTICVLTRRSLSDPDAIFDFFRNLGCESVGFNFDDLAFSSGGRPNYDDVLSEYVSFIDRVIELEQLNDFDLRVRECDQVRRAILARNGATNSSMAHPFAIVTAGVNGDISTCSPELLTLKPPLGDPLVLGNVRRDSHEAIVSAFSDSQIGAAIKSGNAQCKNSCEFYEVCGGGSPINRQYEHGSYETSATFYCDSRIKKTVPLILSRIEQDPTYITRSFAEAYS